MFLPTDTRTDSLPSGGSDVRIRHRHESTWQSKGSWKEAHLRCGEHGGRSDYWSQAVGVKYPQNVTHKYTYAAVPEKKLGHLLVFNTHDYR